MNLILANPRGFCAGVDRAIEIVESAIRLFGAPIYVRHEVVHNRFVIDRLRDKGAVFIENLKTVPNNSTLIFSAHGVSKQIQTEAKERGLKIFDATCPLVTKVHMEVTMYEKKGYECILIGHADHPEVEGTMGQYTSEGIYLVETAEDVSDLNIKDPVKVGFVTQTTLSINDVSIVINALRARFPAIDSPQKEDICYATQNRQNAVKNLSRQCDLILVVGSVNSSNSNRLCEIAKQFDTLSYLIDDATDIEPEWLTGVDTLGLTAGASAPEILVNQVVERLNELGVTRVDEDSGMHEKIEFSLPKELRIDISSMNIQS